MMLRYGERHLECEIPEGNIISVLEPKHVSGLRDEQRAVVRAIRNPIGSPSLKETVSEGSRVALLVSDITRPCPSYKILPPLLTELNGAGVGDEDISIFFATGMHRGHTPEERKKLVGEEVSTRIECIDHNPYGNSTYIGTTKRGTKVSVNRAVLECDSIISVGTIDVHWFAGYGGGAKSVLPGVSACETIRQNHSLMRHPDSKAGKAEGNPVREDMEEGARMANLNFIVNVVLNQQKEIVQVLAGHFIKAHRAGVVLNDRMYKSSIGKKADVVIASVGGFPKDINLYQTQKGLENAWRVVKTGGEIILLAECRDGVGDAVFWEWLEEADGSTGKIIERFEKEFAIGGHKAYAIARVAESVQITLVSKLTESVVRKAFMKPAKSVAEALVKAFTTYGRDATVILMPFAALTLPNE